MVLLVPLAKKQVPFALCVRQLSLQPALVTLSQGTARYAVVSGETSSHVAGTITTWRRTFPVPSQKHTDEIL